MQTSQSKGSEKIGHRILEVPKCCIYCRHTQLIPMRTTNVGFLWECANNSCRGVFGFPVWDDELSEGAKIEPPSAGPDPSSN